MDNQHTMQTEHEKTRRVATVLFGDHANNRPEVQITQRGGHLVLDWAVFSSDQAAMNAAVHFARTGIFTGEVTE